MQQSVYPLYLALYKMSSISVIAEVSCLLTRPPLMSHDILLYLSYTSAISYISMAPKNSPSPDPATPTYSIDEMNWRTLRDIINNSPLEPSVTTRRIEPLDKIPRLSLEEGKSNRIKLQQLGTGDEQVVT